MIPFYGSHLRRLAVSSHPTPFRSLARPSSLSLSSHLFDPPSLIPRLVPQDKQGGHNSWTEKLLRLREAADQHLLTHASGLLRGSQPATQASQVAHRHSLTPLTSDATHLLRQLPQVTGSVWKIFPKQDLAFDFISSLGSSAGLHLFSFEKDGTLAPLCYPLPRLHSNVL